MQDRAISLNAAIKCVESHEYTLKAAAELRELPSVTPQSKTGHWIIKSETSANCSRCHKHNLFYGDFCKWCGVKMVEPQNLKYADNDTMMPAT